MTFETLTKTNISADFELRGERFQINTPIAASFYEKEKSRIEAWLKDKAYNELVNYLSMMGFTFSVEQGLQKPSKPDLINQPPHYAADRRFEPIDVIEDWKLGFCLGNALKYISRAGRKDGSSPVEDLKKGAWYLAREIARLEKELKS